MKTEFKYCPQCESDIVRACNALPACITALERQQQDGECYCVNAGEGSTSGNPCGWCMGNAALALARKAK